LPCVPINIRNFVDVEEISKIFFFKNLIFSKLCINGQVHRLMVSSPYKF